MTDKLERPKFLPSFFAALSERAENQTLWRMLPVPFLAATIGWAIAYFTPAGFWSDEKWDVAATVYTGVLTLNGLILALSWSAFSRIYESISAPDFCAFLRRNKLLNKYIVTISFIHALQLISIILSASGLFALIIDVPYLLIDRVLFGAMLFGSIYAIQQASTSVGIMHDLLWQKSIFDEHHSKPAAKNVVSMGANYGE